MSDRPTIAAWSARRPARGALGRRVAGFSALVCGVTCVAATLTGSGPKPVVDPTTVLSFPGGIVWQVSLPAAPSAPAAFDDHAAYVPLKNGQIIAVDHVKGDVLWIVDRASAVRPLSRANVLIVIESTRRVAVLPTLVRWTTGGLPVIVDDTKIVVINKANGALMWQRGLDRHVLVPPVGTPSVAIISTAEGTVIALDGATGSERWRVEAGSPVKAAPALGSDRAFVPLEDGRVLALRLADGRMLWETRLGGAALEPLVAGDRLFVGSLDNFMYSLACDTGKVKWRWRTGADLLGQPVVDARHVYFTAHDNVLRALDRRGGSQFWKEGLNSRPAAGPTLAGEMLLVGGIAPEIRAYKTKDGSPIGFVLVPGRLVAQPHVLAADGEVPMRIAVLTGGGQFLAIGQTVEPPLLPMDYVPGTRLAPEVLDAARRLFGG